MTLEYSKSVMLVDDEEDILEVLDISLTDMGYTVMTASDGNYAMEQFSREKPPIVLTDIKMPHVDGIELLRNIKHENPDTEVIMMTGHGDMDLAIKSLKYGAIDFIAKPINDDALEIALRRAHEKIITRQQLRDYTRQLENLVREKSKLQDHLSSLGIMIGSISHGIKGLLTRLDGGVYLLDSANSRKAYDEMDEGLDIVKQTVTRIKKMVLDILFYAKKRDLTVKKVNVAAFSKDVARIVDDKINGGAIEFICDVASDAIEVEMDEEFFHSALINILDNAIDACIEDKQKSSHKIVFGIKEDHKTVLFEVSDNGKGMDRETRENIFDLFFSLKGNKGTGFGLFIADNIIKQHRGSINVRSAPGKGTHFIIKIPKKYMDYTE